MSLKLKNMVTVDTATETTVTNQGYRAFTISREEVYEHRDYYIRATVKYTDASFTVEGCLFMVNGGTGDNIQADAPSDNSEVTISGVVSDYHLNTLSGTYGLNFYWLPNPGSGAVTRTITTTYKEVMCIDVTELTEKFPYFASLSDKDKGLLLDETLPFINGGETLEFNGTLRNWVDPAYNKEDWSEGTSSYQLALFSYKYGGVIENKSFLYGRFDFYYVMNGSTVNYDWARLHADSGSYDYVDIVDPLPGVSYSESGIYHFPEYRLDGTTFSIYAGWNTSVDTKIAYWRRVLVMDLYQDGTYLFFRLLGMSDDDIKAYLDTIPFFADTYSIGPAYLDKDGLQYYHGKVKTLLDGKANSSHTHAIDQITDLQTNLDEFKTPAEIVSDLFLLTNSFVFPGYKIITKDDIVDNVVTISLSSIGFSPVPTMLYITSRSIPYNNSIKKIIFDISFLGDGEAPSKNMKFVFKFKALGFCTDRRATTIYSNVVKTAPSDFEYSGVVYYGGDTKKVIFEAGTSPAYESVVGVTDIRILYGVSHYLTSV